MRFESLNSSIVLAVLVPAVVLPWSVWDAIQRLRAGPIRLRLPLASVRRPVAKPAGSITKNPWMPLIITFLVAFYALAIGWSTALFFALLYSSSITGRFATIPRRDKARWSIWVPAGVLMVASVGLIGFGVGALSPPFKPPNPTTSERIFETFYLLAGVGCGVGAVYQFVDAFQGTVLRDRGIEVFGMFFPWSRVVIETWLPDDDEGSLLKLKTLAPKLLGVKLALDSEVVMPVSASDRPAVESFLNQCGAKIAVLAEDPVKVDIKNRVEG